MNFGQLRTAVTAKFNTSASDDQVLTAANVGQWVNDALQFISLEHEWPWLETSATLTTSAGTGMGPYTVPADWMSTRQLLLSGFQPLQQRSIDELFDQNPSSLSGVPRFFAVDADGIWLSPNPNGTSSITHRYLRQEKVLSADGDTPYLPAQFHAAAVDQACYLACSADRESARSQLFLASYERWKVLMSKRARRIDGPAKIRVRQQPMSSYGW